MDKKIKVTIQDVNDNAPLLQPFDGAVVENAASALITTIQALDRDSSPQFRQVRRGKGEKKKRRGRGGGKGKEGEGKRKGDRVGGEGVQRKAKEGSKGALVGSAALDHIKTLSMDYW